MKNEDDQKLTKKERKELKHTEKEQEEQKKLKTQQMKKLLGWGVGIGAVIGLFVFLKVAFTPTNTAPIPETTTVEASDHIKGASESAKLLIEYSDFQCPACKTYQPLVKRLIDEKGDQFAFVYRHFPLEQHKNAEEAAWAAEAAAKQGKFWEMHDMFFDRQESWAEVGNPEELFTSYAKELGLNTDQFATDYAGNDVRDKVANDYASGVRANVAATPTFYLNGFKIQPRSYDEFVKLIEQ